MGTTRIRIIQQIDKIGRYLPVVDKVKSALCYIRWQAYKKRVSINSNLANSSGIAPNVLVLMDSGIGNSIEATPLVQAIRNSWPKASIKIRTASGNLFDNWDTVDANIKNPEDLKGMSFAHTFVPWGGRISLNKGYCDLGMVHYTEEGLNIQCTKPEREYNMDILRRLGYEGPTPPLYVSVHQPDENIPSGSPQFCLVPGATTTHQWRYKHWPYFEELGRLLLDKYEDCRILIIGTEKDQVPAGLLTAERVTDLRDRLSLAETGWVFQQSDLAVGNDCGPMHIADAVPCRSIIIFGPTCEIKNGPAYRESEAIRHEVPCAPCQYGRKLLTCQDPICMSGLTAEAVLEKVETLLSAARGGK